MAYEPDAASDETIGNNLKKAVVSMLRFSSAFTLFGVEMLQSAISCQEGESAPKTMEDVGAVLDSMTESLAERMDQSNRNAVKSATKFAEQVVQQSFDGLSLIDPRQLARIANNLVQKSMEMISDEPEVSKQVEEEKPMLAVDALTST